MVTNTNKQPPIGRVVTNTNSLQQNKIFCRRKFKRKLNFRLSSAEVCISQFLSPSNFVPPFILVAPVVYTYRTLGADRRRSSCITSQEKGHESSHEVSHEVSHEASHEASHDSSRLTHEDANSYRY